MHGRGSDKQADFLPICHVGSIALLSKESADQISVHGQSAAGERKVGACVRGVFRHCHCRSVIAFRGSCLSPWRRRAEVEVARDLRSSRSRGDIR
jgi:hypothetical protein